MSEEEIRQEQYKNGMSFAEEQQLYWDKEIEEKQEIKRELHYMITPSKLDVKELFNYLSHEVSFDKVLSLYILLRNAISTGNLGDDD